MDRYRLAVPAEHHLEDWRNRDTTTPPPEHLMEMTISTYRLFEIMHVAKYSKTGTSAFNEVLDRSSLPASVTSEELVDLQSHLQGGKHREGHIHVWSESTLRDTLRAMENIFDVVVLVAEVTASPTHNGRVQEYRVAILKQSERASSHLPIERWCAQAASRYTTRLRHASPVILGDVDVDSAKTGAEQKNSSCNLLSYAVRAWEKCASKVPKLRRHECHDILIGRLG